MKVENKKNIYKKSLAIDLIKMGHDLIHTMTNKYDPRWQVFVFRDTPELVRDMIYLNERNGKWVV